MKFHASMLWNFYSDLTCGVEISKLVVNVYFGNNVVMVILLKTRIEYPFVHTLSHNWLKLNFVIARKLYIENIGLNKWTASINLKILEGMAFFIVFYKPQKRSTLMECFCMIGYCQVIRKSQLSKYKRSPRNFTFIHQGPQDKSGKGEWKVKHRYRIFWWWATQEPTLFVFGKC